MLIKNARILLPEVEDLIFADVKISDGHIECWGRELSGDDVYDANGLVLAPGFIDLHVHMREPGAEHKGTFRTEGRAAAAGGFTHVFAMPNTSPSPDSKEHYLMIRELSKASVVPVTLYGSVTRSIAGEVFSDIEEMAQEGCRFFSDDGAPIATEDKMIEALERIGALGGFLAVHEEDKSYFSTGSVHRGKYAEAFCVDGIPSESEWKMIERDLALFERYPGAKLHFCHLSTKESVDLIREAKRKGLNVSAEVCPHHFSLTEDILVKAGTLAKVNPPIRTQEDRTALIEGLRSGVIDIIATDHAPHDEESKRLPMGEASFGFTGLEFAFALGNTYLVKTGELKLPKLLRLMSEKPAEVAGLKEGKIEKGYPADLVLLDPDEEWILQREELVSKGKNTPLNGVKLRGKVIATMVSGRWVYESTR